MGWGEEIVNMIKEVEDTPPEQIVDCPNCAWNVHEVDGYLHCPFCGWPWERRRDK